MAFAQIIRLFSVRVRTPPHTPNLNNPFTITFLRNTRPQPS
jgi:hypothetical protein